MIDDIRIPDGLHLEFDLWWAEDSTILVRPAQD